jgi:hypothetical protein
LKGEQRFGHSLRPTLIEFVAIDPRLVHELE